MKSNQKVAGFILYLSLLTPPAATIAQARQQESKQKTETQRVEAGRVNDEARKIVKEGISVDFSIKPPGGGQGKPAELMEGEKATVQFKIADAATGTPLTGLRPSAWLDLRQTATTTTSDCRTKIQSFLQGSLKSRPQLDLNTYYVLALNREPNISVIDPLLSYGNSKLYTLVLLKSAGEDWVASKDQKKLFVSMPQANQVAVIDTAIWKVTNNIDVGSRPTRLALQGDEKYLWVSNSEIVGAEAEAGVTVIDVATLKVAARLRTGAGHHEFAFSTDDRHAFITNKQDGTVSVVDVGRLAKVKDIKTGLLPTAVTFSALGGAIYVANEGDGHIVVIDSRSHETLARIAARPGLKTIRFAANGRWGFAPNSKENVVHIIDSSSNKIRESVPVGKGPDQVSFTRVFAYVRAKGSDQISMIELASIGKSEKANVITFPGGQIPPDDSADLISKNVLVPAPEGNSVLLANPADKMIYYYTEGMAAPMGGFQNYRREPRSVTVIDRSLRETSPGVYSTNVTLTRGGNYDAAFLLDSPRIHHCFDTTVKPNLALRKSNRPAFRVEWLIEDAKVRAGEKVRLRFKAIDSTTGKPIDNVKDIGVLTLLAPGVWHKRQWAEPVGQAVYEITFTPPESGVYYVFWECPSLKVKLNQLPYLILDARQEDQSLPVKTSNEPSADKKR